MTTRTTTLAALGAAAALALVFAFVPKSDVAPPQATPPGTSPPPTLSSIDSASSGVPAKVGPKAHGVIDSLVDGGRITLLAAAHARITAVHRTGTVLVNGWAVTDRNLLGRSFIYRIDAGPWYDARYSIPRPDVGAALKNPDVEACGFTARVSMASVTPGKHRITLALVDGDRLEFLDVPVTILVQ